MDKLDRYRRIVQHVVARHAELVPSHGQIETMPIYDTNHDKYLLLDVGWNGTGRVHAIVFHAHFRDGKVWVEWDGAEPSITQELLDAGIPKEDVVLAFYRPERRELTEFSVA